MFYRCEYLWCIVSDRVLPAPLLQEKDEKGDHESDKVAFAKEGFPDTETLTRVAFFVDGCFDLCYFMPDGGGVG